MTHPSPVQALVDSTQALGSDLIPPGQSPAQALPKRRVWQEAYPPTLFPRWSSGGTVPQSSRTPVLPHCILQAGRAPDLTSACIGTDSESQALAVRHALGQPGA